MKRLINFTKKILLNGGLFIFFIVLTYRLMFAKLNVANAIELLLGFNPLFLIIAILSVATMLALETLTIKRNLHVLGEHKSYLSCVKYTFAGNFFSIITPAATGGQPMQIYLMNKDRIGTDKATLALMLDLAAYQIVIITLSLFGFFTFFNETVKLFGSFYPMLIVGIVLNSSLLALTLLAIFSKTLIYQIVILCSGFLRTFRYKKADRFETLALQWVTRYQQSAKVLRDNKKSVVINIALMFIRISIMFTAPLWVYMGLGLSGSNLLFIVAMQAVLHISCAALPLPGGVGVGEAIFLICFSTIFPSSLIDTAMLLSRGIGLYSIALISGVALFVWYVVSYKKQHLRVQLPANAGII
ncbi:MAG: lysylphosphatidylglycerol synthase transmembrane domain-containing protein [Candidatus Fimivivens sp.]|nr:lysylphosphatidylglycerol synthase transmembrane domain-containing protein [Candidatus Fimivivens sp.]